MNARVTLPANAPLSRESHRVAIAALLCALAAGTAAAQSTIKLAPLAPAQPATRAMPAAAEEEPPADESEAGAQPGAPADPAAAGAAPISPEELAELKAQLEALPKDRQDEMKAYYKDLGYDLDVLLGYASAASTESARIMETVGALRSSRSDSFHQCLFRSHPE